MCACPFPMFQLIGSCVRCMGDIAPLDSELNTTHQHAACGLKRRPEARNRSSVQVPAHCFILQFAAAVFLPASLSSQNLSTPQQPLLASTPQRQHDSTNRHVFAFTYCDQLQAIRCVPCESNAVFREYPESSHQDVAFPAALALLHQVMCIHVSVIVKMPK